MSSHEHPYYSDGSHGYRNIAASSSVESRWDQRENIIKHIVDRGGYEYSNRHEIILAIWRDLYLTGRFRNMWRAVNEHLPGL